jgi:hypothetical protein
VARFFVHIHEFLLAALAVEAAGGEFVGLGGLERCDGRLGDVEIVGEVAILATEAVAVCMKLAIDFVLSRFFLLWFFFLLGGEFFESGTAHKGVILSARVANVPGTVNNIANVTERSIMFPAAFFACEVFSLLVTVGWQGAVGEA